MKTGVGKKQTFAAAFVGQALVPARQSFFAVFDILGAQDFVQRVAQRHFRIFELIVFDGFLLKVLITSEIAVLLLVFFLFSFQTRRKKVRGVRADLTAKQI